MCVFRRGNLSPSECHINQTNKPESLSFIITISVIIIVAVNAIKYLYLPTYYRHTFYITLGTVSSPCHCVRVRLIYSWDAICSWASALSARGTLTTGSWLSWPSWGWAVAGAGRPLSSPSRRSFSAIQLATTATEMGMLPLSCRPPRMEMIVARPADELNIVLYFRALVTDRLDWRGCHHLSPAYQTVSMLPINVVASIGFCRAVVILARGSSSSSSSSTD